MASNALAAGEGGWPAFAADGEAVEVVERDGGNLSGQGARDLGAEGEGAEGGVLADSATATGLRLAGRG